MMVQRRADFLKGVHKSKGGILFSILVTAFLLCCNGSQGTDFSQNVSTKRIVVIGPPLYLDIIKVYGDLSAVVAVTNAPNLPREVRALPRVGSSLLPNLEAVISHHPTLVVGGLQSLRGKLPPNIRFFPGEALIQNLGQLKDLVRQMGGVLDKRQNEVDAVLSDFEARLQNQTHRAAHCTKKSVAVLLLSSSDLYTIGTHSIEYELLSLAKGEPILKEAIPGQPISLELLFSLNPDILVTDSSMLSRIMQDHRLLKLKAIQKKQVFGISMADFVSTKAPELLGALIDLLHQQDPSSCLTSSETPLKEAFLKTFLPSPRLFYED